MNRNSSFINLAIKLLHIKLSNAPNQEIAMKRTLFYTLKDMGGVYIKFLQIMSVTHKFMEGWGGPAEMKVFDQVDTESIDVSSMITNFGAFASFDLTPFATGSFAQVYRAQLTTGELVAIKILRPSIAHSLRHDLRVLRRIVKLFGRFLPSTILDYQAAIDEFCESCLLETDYNREISNMQYFTKLYSDSPHVVIPRVYEHLSSSNIIVQDFIEGPTLASIMTAATPNKPASRLATELTGSNLWTQITIAGGEALRTAMCADFIFGDPHPGNIILLPNNRIAFIDFGIIAEKPTSQRAFYEWTLAYHDILTGKGSYAKLLETCFVCFCPDVANALRSCECNNPDGTSITILDSITMAVESKLANIKNNNKLAQDLFSNGHLFRLFTDALDSNNALNVKLDMTNFKLVKAMQAFLGSVTTLDNNEDHNVFTPVMVNAMRYALDYCHRTGVPNDIILKSKYSKSESYALLLDTFSSLAEGDQFIFQYISGIMST